MALLFVFLTCYYFFVFLYTKKLPKCAKFLKLLRFRMFQIASFYVKMQTKNNIPWRTHQTSCLSPVCPHFFHWTAKTWIMLCDKNRSNPWFYASPNLMSDLPLFLFIAGSQNATTAAAEFCSVYPPCDASVDSWLKHNTELCRPLS